MHLKRLMIHPEKFPQTDQYPFNQEIFHRSRLFKFTSPVTFLVGENGSGKSTLLEAIAHKCGIHIWKEPIRTRFESNPYEKALYRFITVKWENGFVPGSFFSSELFRYFSQYLDEWATSDPEMLQYFGGKSLINQSHGQSLMSYFKYRYTIPGLYLLDEPESALSPRSQLNLLEILIREGGAGHAQFIIASHSPILMACPGARIYNFDENPARPIQYEETTHYQIYKDFMNNRRRFFRSE